MGLILSPLILGFPVSFAFLGNLYYSPNNIDIKLTFIFIFMILLPIILGVYLVRTSSKSIG